MIEEGRSRKVTMAMAMAAAARSGRGGTGGRGRRTHLGGLGGGRARLLGRLDGAVGVGVGGALGLLRLLGRSH